jgi:hypothetical protein
MIRLCVLSTWADIYIETIKNEKIKGLSGIVQTNLQTLASSWLNILKEYSRVRYMSDVNVGVGLSEEGNREILALFAESMYVDFVKASIMPLYESRITSLTEALAICFENSVINLGDFPRELASEMFLDILAQNVQFISEQIRFRGEAAAKVDMDRQLLASLQIISSLFNTNQRFDKIVDFLDADMIMELLRVVEALLWQSVSRNQVSEIETALKIFLRVVEPSFVLTICSQSGFPADFAYLLLRSFIGVCASFTLCSAGKFFGYAFSFL